MNNTIPLLVDVPDGLEAGVWPVTAGIPFADREDDGLAPGEAVTVFRGEAPVPTQARVTALWPSGRVRWLLVDFQVDAAADQSSPAGYSLRPATGGASASGLLLSTPVHGNAAPFRVTLDERLAYVTRFGRLELRLGASTGNGAWSAAVPAPIEFFVRHGDKTFWAHLDDDLDGAATVELEGPLRTTILAKGEFRAADGDTFCRFEIRFDFFAASSLVRVVHTFIYTDKGAKRSVDQMAMRIPLDGQGAHAVGIDAEDLSSVDTTGAARLTRLLTTSRCPRVALDGANPIAGRASGWATVSGATGGVAVALRDAWQNAPNGVHAADDHLLVELWPAEGAGPLDLAPEAVIRRNYGGDEAFDTIRDWYCALKKGRGKTAPDPFGMAKTHELWLDVWSGDSEDRGPRLGLQADHPVFALAEPAHNCATEALGPMHPVGNEAFDDADAALDATFDMFLRWQLQWREYGWLIYGDVHTFPFASAVSEAATVPSAHLPDLKRTWAASHYGFPKVPWLLFYRSGERKYLEFAEANARHVMDVDRCHHGDLPTVSGPPGAQQLAPGGFSDTEGPCTFLTTDLLRRFRGHHYWDEATIVIGDSVPLLTNYEVLEFMPYGAYLRGYRRGMDVLTDWYDAVSYFHPLEVEGSLLTEHFLRILFRKGEVLAGYKDAWYSHLPWHERIPPKNGDRLPFDQVRHIAAPLGNLVEWGRASRPEGEAHTAWAALVTDYIETLLTIHDPDFPEPGPVCPLLWRRVRAWDFRISGQKLRHAWGGLTNALRLLQEMDSAGESTFASDLTPRLRALVVDWAYRAARTGFDGQYSFEDVAYGLMYSESEAADPDVARRREDLLDLGMARLQQWIDRTNTVDATEGATGADASCSALPDWREKFGARGSSASSSIFDTYRLQSLPVFLQALHQLDSAQLAATTCFRLVGPRMPSLRLTVHDPDAWRFKVRLGRGQGMNLLFANQRVVHIGRPFEEEAPEDLTDLVRVEEFLRAYEIKHEVDLEIAAGTTFKVFFDRASGLDAEGTLPIQRAIVDVLRMEHVDVAIDHDTMTLDAWKDATELGEPESLDVFRAFGTRFWFDVPAGVEAVTVSAYVGKQQGMLPYSPTLHLYNHEGNPVDEDGVGADELSVQETSMARLVVSASADEGDTLPAGAWSFGPIAHMSDPFRRHDRQRIPEATGDAGFRTWVTVQLEGSNASVMLHPLAPT